MINMNVQFFDEIGKLSAELLLIIDNILRIIQAKKIIWSSFNNFKKDITPLNKM